MVNVFFLFLFYLFYLLSFIISQAKKKKKKKKKLQNETDIENANMFKWYNDYIGHNYTK